MALRITNRTYVTGPEPNQGEGPCGDEARRSAEEPEATSEAPSTYVLLCDVPVPNSTTENQVARDPNSADLPGTPEERRPAARDSQNMKDESIVPRIR